MSKISRAQFLSTSGFLALAGSARLSAQGGDTPIVIRDGSLKIKSAAKWSDFSIENTKRRRHPNNGKRVTSVQVQLGGNQTTIQFTGQRCEVKLTYAKTDVLLFTNPSGRNLRIETDWDSFKPGAEADDLEHSNPNSSISRVIVRRGETTVVDESPNGGTVITIHYQD